MPEQHKVVEWQKRVDKWYPYYDTDPTKEKIKTIFS